MKQGPLGFALQHLIWLLAMAVGMAWLAGSRLRTRRIGSATILEYPGRLLALYVFYTVALLLVGILSWHAQGPANGPLPISFAFFGFALLGIPGIVQCLRVRCQLEPEGLRYRRFLGKTICVEWTEIARIHYNEYAKWFRIDTTNRQVLRISAWFTGLPEFAELILSNVHPALIDPKTLPILQRTAAGNPPAIWSG